MSNEMFLLILLVLILLYFIPEKDIIYGRIKQRQNIQYQKSQQSQQTQQSQQSQQTQQINSDNQIQTELINDYLGDDCKEGFETMGPNMNIGNNMDFQQEIILPNKLDKALSKSLVPDFEPNSLNINSNLNTFGYATTDPTSDNYYENRGYFDPIDASQYANSIQYNLAHPYQTRYCDK